MPVINEKEKLIPCIVKEATSDPVRRLGGAAEAKEAKATTDERQRYSCPSRRDDATGISWGMLNPIDSLFLVYGDLANLAFQSRP
jgi:hypothetical protein